MGKGLRIHHPIERDVILLIPLPAKTPEGSPKDIHIHLDEEGDSIVSEGVWEELLEAKRSGLSAHEFIVLNEVLDPPTIIAGPRVPNQEKRTRVERRPGTIYDAELQAIAQQFAPNGLKTYIATNRKEDG